MENKTTIADVSDTSYWVAHYRAVETERPDALFKDPFAKKLVGDRGRLIAEKMKLVGRYAQWAVVSRTVMIDDFITQLNQEGVDTVLNLGAGLDTRPYRMKLPKDLNWIEVDFPQIIKHKSEILKSEKPVCLLSRVELDLSNDLKRKQFLSEVAP
jgi:methyltransferase (TIGR00027 family)